MALKYGFFNSKDGDRKYTAADIGDYLQGLVSSGVFADASNSLQVLASGGMTVEVQAGRAMLQFKKLENDSPYGLVLTAGGTQDRIDAIVAYMDLDERLCGIMVKEGTPAAAPVAPTLTRSSAHYEIMLATVYVTKLSNSITQSNITDTRANTAVCGWVTGLIDQVDTSTLFAQWQAAYEEEYARTQDYLAAQQAAWETFFSTVTEDLVLPAPALTDAGKAVVVNPDGTGYVLDDPVTTDATLSQPGAAADAAATGEAIQNAAPFNYLDNSDFRRPVNQRGATSYSNGGIYTIDRWKKRNTGLLSVIANEGIEITSVGTFGGIIQPIEKGTARLAGKTVTLAAYVLESPGAFEMMLGNTVDNSTVGTTYGEKTFTEAGLCVSSVTLPETFEAGDYLNFFIGEGEGGAAAGSKLKIAWCALYEGEYTAENLPKYQPKGYGAERLECQRYFVKFLAGVLYGVSNVNGSTVCIALPATMRSDRPTVTLNSSLWVYFPTGSASVAELRNSVVSQNVLQLALSATSASNYNVCVPDFRATISADL